MHEERLKIKDAGMTEMATARERERAYPPRQPYSV